MVDDDIVYLEVAKLRLTDLGFNVMIENNPLKALEYIKKNNIDILLLDYFMPEKTGEEFLFELRKFNRELVVILQTGYAGEKSQIDMMESLNIQGYYDKTKSVDTLVTLIYSAIKYTIL